MVKIVTRHISSGVVHNFPKDVVGGNLYHIYTQKLTTVLKRARECWSLRSHIAPATIAQQGFILTRENNDISVQKVTQIGKCPCGIDVDPWHTHDCWMNKTQFLFKICVVQFQTFEGCLKLC